MAQRHTFTLSNRHEAIMFKMSKKLETSYVNTLERALEALEEKDAERDAKIGAKHE